MMEGGTWGGGWWREKTMCGFTFKIVCIYEEFKFLQWFHTKLLSSNKGSFAPLMPLLSVDGEVDG